MKYNKLIRDLIPEIIEKKGGTYRVHIADDAEYWSQLKDKLQEEVAEFLESEEQDELADILEVLYAIFDHQNISRDAIETIRAEKAQSRGAFHKKLILDEVENG